MNDTLIYSKQGLTLTEGFEGFRSAAYQDQAGVWTIGYGHTGQDVKPTTVVTQEQAEQLLAHDVQTAENAVKSFVKVALTQAEFDGLVDFVFNLGAGRLLTSTLLKLLNAGKYSLAALEFDKWNKVAGKVNNGIARRRLAETELFQHGIIQVTA